MPTPPLTSRRGRKRCTVKFPGLKEAIDRIMVQQGKSIVDPQLKDDDHKYTALTVRDTVGLLKKEFTAQPSVPTMYRLLNEMGYKLTRVEKTRPLKRIAATDDIRSNPPRKRSNPPTC